MFVFFIKQVNNASTFFYYYRPKNTIETIKNGAKENELMQLADLLFKKEKLENVARILVFLHLSIHSSEKMKAQRMNL